jgi:exportin-5
MDESLVKLWAASLLHKEFVLTTLETLSEDIFYREDTVSSLRGTELNRALVEIFTPLAVFEEVFPERDRRVVLRYESEGWLSRTCNFLDACLENMQTSSAAKDCALKCLAVIKSGLVWAIPKAVVSCHCVASICRTLTSQNDQVLVAAVEALHALYSRSNYNVEEFQPLVYFMYQTDHLVLLRQVYEWSVVSARNLDETRYAISKRLSELMSYVAGFLEEKAFNLQGASGINLPLFLDFLVAIFRHESLTVSIPILHSFSRLLASEKLGNVELSSSLLAPLLETCTQRLVRWESLPEGSDDPTMMFLNEDIDTIPERHAFVGNYRRYCSSVIEIIVQKLPHDAIPHILSGVDAVLNNLYQGIPPFSVEMFRKTSFPLMRADTQFTVVEATLKGCTKWVATHGQKPQQDEQKRRELEGSLETWALNLMQRSFEV